MANTEMLGLMPLFMAQTRSRLKDMETYRQAMSDQQDGAAAMKAIYTLAHTISGTADTFGFADLGKYARRIDDITLHTDFGPEDTAVLRPQMEIAVTELMQEMSRVLSLE